VKKIYGNSIASASIKQKAEVMSSKQTNKNIHPKNLEEIVMFNQNSFSGRKAQALVAGTVVAVIGFSNISFGQSDIAGAKPAKKYRTEQISDKDVILTSHEASDKFVNENIQLRDKVLANRELEGPKGLAMPPNRQLEGPKGLAMPPNRELEGPKGLAMPPNRELEGPKGLAMPPNRQLEGPKGLAMPPNRELEGPKGLAMPPNRQLEGPRGLAMN
jgi:hypothetical protein